MQTWRIELPYERPPLSLNQRLHWRAKANLTSDIRLTSGLFLRAKGVPKLQRAEVWLEWVVPDQRRRDTDNPVPTLKACADALVDVGIIPDDTPEFVSKSETQIVFTPRVKKLYLMVRGEPWTS